jgi:protein O-GlcNAc transferase
MAKLRAAFPLGRRAGETADDTAVERFIEAGHGLEDAGDFDGALREYRRALAQAPNLPRTHMNVGNALRRLERWDEAIASQRNAVACAPDYARARFNLGILLGERGERGAGIEELLEALRLEPSMFEARVRLAEFYEEENRYDDAERELQHALALAPSNSGILMNVGLFYLRQGRVEDALQSLQLARQLDPDLTGSESPLLWAMNYRYELSLDAIAEEHFRVGTLITQRAGTTIRAWNNEVDPTRRLRIGYVSGDFGPHPVALFIRPVLERHDRSAFEIFCYSNHAGGEPIRQTLHARADNWREIHDLDDGQVVQMLHRDGIDILVDLAGHTNFNRLSLFARHPVPVQVTWLGYLNTTGLRAMDYRIADAHTDPIGATERYHSERLVRMPDSQWCYFAWNEIPRMPIPHPDRPNALVFGSFNQHSKLTNRTLALWGRILRELSQSELLVFDVRQQSVRDSLENRMHAHGIDLLRVHMRGREPIFRYFDAIGHVDIALDSQPYNGATTTFDTLWMGVPVVGLRGDRGIARGSYSILRTLGADELIANDDDDYVNLNVRLARDPRWRSELRKTLRNRLASSRLMDARHFTRALEAEYREMWRTWCNQQSQGSRSPTV